LTTLGRPYTIGIITKAASSPRRHHHQGGIITKAASSPRRHHHQGGIITKARLFMPPAASSTTAPN
jgi:hypothetical protein